MVDDTSLDKPYAREAVLVPRHWSRKHKRVGPGINRLSLLQTQGRERLIREAIRHHLAHLALIRRPLRSPSKGKGKQKGGGGMFRPKRAQTCIIHLTKACWSWAVRYSSLYSLLKDLPGHGGFVLVVR